MSAKPPLGVFAGGGPLPARIAARCEEQGRAFLILAFQGQTDPETIADRSHVWITLGGVSNILKQLRAADVGEVVMAGKIRRPSLSELRPDLKGARLLARFSKRLLGDDSVLRVVIEILAEEGLTVVGVESILDDLLLGAGSLGRHAPALEDLEDIRRGMEVLEAMGRADVGQACVVQRALVLAVEAIEGTDAMIARAGPLRRDGPGGVLVKRRKPGQEDRADRPALGPVTVEIAAAAGLVGIAGEAEGCILMDRVATRAAADDAGLFVFGAVVESGKS